jgi:hypothetical protein
MVTVNAFTLYYGVSFPLILARTLDSLVRVPRRVDRDQATLNVLGFNLPYSNKFFTFKDYNGGLLLTWIL